MARTVLAIKRDYKSPIQSPADCKSAGTGNIYDQYSGFGAHSVIGNSNLFNADYDIYSHELHHLWQSRAFGNAFVFNYVLQGIEAVSMGGSFLEKYNYFEDIANRRFWW